MNAKFMTMAVAALFAFAALSPDDATAQRAVPDTLGKIKAARQINVAFSADSLPFSFVGDGDQPAGYSIDLCKKVIAQIGRAVGESNLKVNWLVGTVSERLAMVASGRADLECANTTETQTRLKDVDFSNRIFLDGGGFLVSASSNAKRFADLAGKKIGVLAGTTTEIRLRAMLKERQVNAEVVAIRAGPEGMAMLEAGSIDAFASDKIKLVGLATQAKDPGIFVLLADELSYEPLAFALPRGDSALRLEINRALTQVYVSGEIEPIFVQWLGHVGRPSGLLAAMYLLGAIPQ